MAKKKKRNRGGGTPFNPDIDTGTRRPVTARVAVGDVNDKFSDYPSNGLTPRRLASIFREADEGNVRAQMELFEEMEEKDTHLFSQMQTRKLAVTGLDWEVQPFSEDAIDKEIADFVDEQLKGIENFDEVLIDMLDAIGKGISIMELAWTVEDGRNVIEDIEYVHPKKLVWDSTTDELKDDMKNVIIGDEYIEDEQEREEKIATLCDAAIVDACAEIDGYLAKRYRLPLRKVPQVINKFAKDISVYNLVSRTGIDESEREKTFLNRYNAAIKFLLDVAKGTISIGVEDIGGGSEAANGFKMKSSGRVFSRESMRGW